MFWIAQAIPNGEMLQGDSQSILAWVILAQAALFIATVVYFVRKLDRQEQKYDRLSDKTLKVALRSQQALAVIAELPPPEVEETLSDKEEDF